MIEKVNRVSLINSTILLRGYEKYLEIGVQDGGTLRHIKADYKVGVDPDGERLKNAAGCADEFFIGTSDEFFEQNNTTFDLIFIDGLHQWDQVLEDAENALAALSPEGTIIFHDCCPTTEDMAAEKMHSREWCGTVWKAIAKIRSEWDHVEIRVHPDDYGLGVMRRLHGVKRNLIELPVPFEKLKYKHLEKHRVKLLNLTASTENLL